MLFRDRILFLRCLKYVLITGGIFLAICVLALKLRSAGENKDAEVLSLMIVNEDADSGIGSFILNVVSANENISAAVELVPAATEEEAVKAVKEGAAGALILPEDFFASVNQGENYPCRIILNDENAAAAQTIRYFADAGSDMLFAAQTAIFEGDLFLAAEGADENQRSEYNLFLNTQMVGEIADAPDRYFRLKDLGFTNRGLSVFGHYIDVYLAFFFGILSMAFFHLYRDDCEKDKLIRLASGGVKKGRFLLWKVLLPAVVEGAVLAAVCIFAGGSAELSVQIRGIVFAVCAVLFAAFFGACIGISLGSASSAVLFIVFFAGLFFSGGIIPYSALSQTALTIGAFTPLGVIYAFLSPLFGGAFEWISLIPAAAYVLIGILLYASCLNRMMLGKETV